MRHASEFRAESYDTPEWVRPITAACVALTGATSNIISSIDVSGVVGTADRDRRRLLSLVERLAEEYDLEVTLNFEGNSFVARFATAETWYGGTHA